MNSLSKVLIGTLCFGISSLASAATTNPPNILLLVADDLGFSDIRALGGEIDTPNLDQLIGNGKLLTDFHSAPSCSPTRAMLMTGNDPHLVGLGMMAEYRHRLFAEKDIRAGYDGTLEADAVTLAELLQDAGYMTSIAGKWHLGKTKELQPQSKGFEQSYVVLEGGAAHFKQKEMGILEAYPATFIHNGDPLELPDDYHASTYFTDQLIETTRAAKEANKPFFAFAAYTSPHWPLQAPDHLLEKYKGRYDSGYQAIADKRLVRLKELGFLPESLEPKAILEDVPAWDSLSPEERKLSAKKMEIYAAMVDSLDHEIGRLVDHLKSIGEYENTLILFMSDNGAESQDRAPAMPKWIADNFDNSFENLGRPNSFVMYGPAWAQVSAQPGRKFKQTVFEGGIRVPAFVHFPAKIEKGVSKELASARDVMPTFLELAGVQHPGIEYRGRPVRPSLGSSMLPYLTGDEARIHSKSYALGTEYNGSAALRSGKWKLIFMPKETDGQWFLFDLNADPTEQRNVASNHPDVVEELLAEWRSYSQSNNIATDNKGIPLFPAVKPVAGQ